MQQFFSSPKSHPPGAALRGPWGGGGWARGALRWHLIHGALQTCEGIPRIPRPGTNPACSEQASESTGFTLSRRWHPRARPTPWRTALQISRGSLAAVAWHGLQHGCPLPGSASLANCCCRLAAVSAEGLGLPRAARAAGRAGAAALGALARAASARGPKISPHLGPLTCWDEQRLPRWSWLRWDARPYVASAVGAAQHAHPTLTFEFLINIQAEDAGMVCPAPWSCRGGRDGGTVGCAGPEQRDSSLCPSPGTCWVAAKGGWRGIKRVASQHMQAKSERSPGSAASSRACAESWLLEPASPASACPC